jgi:hypothetical protein
VPVVAHLFMTRLKGYHERVEAGGAVEENYRYMPKKLAGIGIGNGVVDPKEQFKMFPKYLKENGFVSEAERVRHVALFTRCILLSQL